MTCVILLAFYLLGASLAAAENSVWSNTSVKKEAGITVFTVEDKATGKPLPFRAIIKASDGTFADGSKRGVYNDGRFFADGYTSVKLPAGVAQIQISAGPEYLPLSFEIDVSSSAGALVEVSLHRWIHLADRGWYGGDNHVHARHDDHAPIKTSLSYAALQARAGGLNFITESGSSVSYDELESLNTEHFKIRHCGEIRPGPYIGHFNPAGLTEPLEPEFYEKLIQRPLPAQALYAEVRKRGGIMIHTHPLMPRHQLHWMGASEAWSDAVLQNTADLFDVDANHTERLWFTLLNLGNKIGVSGHTDAALGRTNTKSPGDQRIYCRGDRVDYDHFLESMRAGKTMATNGGPLFGFLSIGGAIHPGDTMPNADKLVVDLEIQGLNELESAAIYLNGERKVALNVRGKSGPLKFSEVIRDVPQDRDSWLVARVQDKKGKWCLTSPIYIDIDTAEPKPAATVLF
ncbi:MAG: CehA/McbA family metallohydrolase, partial [Verrucomicrobiota bacterium]